MGCRIIELRDKQVISVKDGSVIGYVGDLEIDINNGKLTSIVINGRARGLGLLGHEDDIIIPWDSIKVIGGDSILVNYEMPLSLKKRRGYFA